jgi:uncharacterized protein
VIAVDTNVLVHAHRQDSDHHAAALAAVESLAEGSEPVGLPWPVVHEFLAIVTHPRVFDPPSATGEAIAAIVALTELPHVSLLAEGHDHLLRMAGLVTTSGVRGPKIHDARIAAICLSHGVRELLTADRDFSWFPSLRTRNPFLGQ